MKRLIVYFHYDPLGQIDTACRVAVEAMAHYGKVFFISNGTLRPADRAWAASVTLTCRERENKGLDVGAYKEALAVIGRGRLARYDELVLMNFTLAGPVCSLASMFAAMEAVRLAFLMQLPAFRVAFADLPSRRAIIVILLVEGLLAQLLAVTVYGLVQLFQIRFGRPLHHDRHLFVFVGFGLDVGRIRIQNCSAHQSLFHGLAQNLIEDLLGNVVIPETALAVHAQRCGVRMP